MTSRITLRDLEALAFRINQAAGTPTQPYTKDAEGNYHANPGNYHLDQAYGGVKLVQMVGDAGGVSDITTGYVSKRECWDQMQAFLAGLMARR